MDDKIKEGIENAVNALTTYGPPPQWWGSSFTKAYEKEYAEAKDNYREILTTLIKGGMSLSDAIVACDNLIDWIYDCGKNAGLDAAGPY